ncbi:hypothetical protein PYH58_12085 [Mammaliicoccus sciuri]|jgi:enamine deaminase RidA (YjgF/YER057c/UK114 family)|uniref:hypothetical protein n=1 Tax=Mammaliicoccus sciuri TaxID=1296 RepID=UPI0021CFDD25|nr:hypothetical protein [Mammaliicoccus sciuri]UXV31719.1 hypothetical protein MUA60_12345 [Mammaliicoccus sciuri]
MSIFEMSEEKEYLRNLVVTGYYDTKKAIRQVVDNDNEILALHYLSKANSYFVTLESYVRSKEDLYRYEFIQAVDAFNNVYKEALNCVRDNHSHQHTVIYFNEFKEKLYPVLGYVDSNLDLELNN